MPSLVKEILRLLVRVLVELALTFFGEEGLKLHTTEREGEGQGEGEGGERGRGGEGREGARERASERARDGSLRGVITASNLLMASLNSAFQGIHEHH